MIARLIALVAARSAGRNLKQFHQRLQNCRTVQDRLLSSILSRHAQSDFGRQYGFDRLTGYADFAAALPPANYAHLAPYIDRCRAGETNALLGPGEELLMFALTSGTTAPAKYIPVTRTFINHYRYGWNVWGIKALSDHPAGYLRRILQVTSPPDEETTPGGHPCGAISGMLARHQKYIVRRYYATPGDVARIADPLSRYYTIMRLAVPQDVAFISTANPSTTLTLAQTASDHAERLIRDVHDGALTPPGEGLSDGQRAALAEALRPQHKRAAQLQQCLDANGRLWPCDYWRVAFLANWTGGSTGLYLPRLREYFGNPPIRDIGLLASEGRFSICLSDNTPVGVLDITGNFYEFVPRAAYEAAGAPAEQPTLPADLPILRADEVETGQEYYLLITNTAGLYRYNMGDLVRVAGFAQATPMIEFLSKGAHTSSLTGEKLTENQVVTAVNAAAEQVGVPVATFVMAPHWAEPPHYELHCECAADIAASQLERLAEVTDRVLMQTNIEYESKRHTARLGPVRAVRVANGRLSERDRALMRRHAGRAEQFKHRFLRNEPLDSMAE